MTPIRRTKKDDWSEFYQRLAHFSDDGQQYTLIAEYGLHYIKGNKLPYFYITADLLRGGWTLYAYNNASCSQKERALESCGCLHDEIGKHLPELKDLIQWHLCDVDGTPLHYIANSMYFYEGGRDVKAFEHAAKIQEREREEYQDKSVDEIKAWLKWRLPKVRQRFLADMARFNINVPYTSLCM